MTTNMAAEKNTNPEIIAAPPRLYLIAFTVSVILHLVHPVTVTDQTLYRMAIGVTLLVINAILVRWAFVTMRTAQTSPNPFELSTALVVTGPFSFSRNPVYVAMTGLYLAVALLINSLWPLLLLFPLVITMHRGVIWREELYLEQRFGAAYVAYKMRVRRWL